MSGGEVRAFLGLGSNLGDRLMHLREAVRQIGATNGIRIERCAGVYESEPWGLSRQPDYLNTVVEAHTELRAPQLFACMKVIERNMGRLAAPRYHPRIIDIDILFHGADVLSTPELIVPHPALHQRRFVLLPMMELAPDFRHPTLGVTINDLYATCPDMGRVKRTAYAIAR